ncbi:Pre-mRNA-splicing factor [Wickerhamomyces ciferrii]|uniref:RNA helicase n=1 Tax=Wickerhamomyces ciferrii (strain ATCC 14091 / BCRC 22168 / CBS 111 / JCM 3599 / NBRC 0793 / NRRL Y-1031 F-60-10) TaxID=1206466 RepID=K0KMX3_WICCF|nr:Pre-mRNA-splicing factor [Wickerhamomyces ciferrii]CCH42714.1 Pre-mRNA-splicing factor [Wickerhamomyces ciferrii]
MSEGIQEGRGHQRRRDADRWASDSESEGEEEQVVQKEEEEVKEEVEPVDEDTKEREDFAKRLIEKDNKRDVESSRNEDQDVSELRQLARQKYLSRREQDRLILLEKEVQNLEQDVQEYGWENLTQRERDDISHKREVLALIHERKQLESGDNGYALPEDYVNQDGKIDRKRKEDALYTKQKEVGKILTDHEQWENKQVGQYKKSKIVHPDEIVAPNQEEYEYVFDDSQNIEFLLDGQGESSNLTPEQQLLEKKIKEEEKRIQSIDEVRKSLPVYQYRTELLEAIKQHQVLIVVGETGSGKTTQLPQYLFEDGYSSKGLKIACTQPRRVAAMSVAARVADEMGVRIGHEVGYSVRFDDKTNEKTVVKYMTDGMLLREFLTDPELSDISALMIDEAHERTLSTDILFGLVKDIAKHRPDLRLLISSATMNAEKFSSFFGGAPIFNIPGRRFPVDIHYTTQPEANYIHAAITTVFQIHTSQGPGDILVFLTGQDEIESMAENLTETYKKLGSRIKEMIICPIYANLPSDLQQQIFEPTPPNARKVVLATNIAETSITIDGVVYVIDPGFVKENVYNPSTGMESLVVTACSRASADQRAGRAGRVGPGKCFRLFTKWAYFNELPANPTPEILRTNLASVVLLLLSLGINDLIHFDFMDSPATETLMKALELLYALGALNGKGQLTKLGRQMAEFPTDPMLAKSLLSSEKYKCTDEVLSIISMLGESSALFFRPKDKKLLADTAKDSFTKESDHLTLLEIFNQWIDSDYSSQWCHDNFLQYKSLQRARNVRDQLERLCDRVEIMVNSKNNQQDNEHKSDKELSININKALASGFFPNAARLSKMGDNYRSLKKNQTVYIHPSSVLYKVKPPPKLVIYNELVLTSKEFMRNCLPIQEKWLAELAPHYFNTKELDEMESNSRKMPKMRK